MYRDRFSSRMLSSCSSPPKLQTPMKVTALFSPTNIQHVDGLRHGLTLPVLDKLMENITTKKPIDIITITSYTTSQHVCKRNRDFIFTSTKYSYAGSRGSRLYKYLNLKILVLYPRLLVSGISVGKSEFDYSRATCCWRCCNTWPWNCHLQVLSLSSVFIIWGTNSEPLSYTANL